MSTLNRYCKMPTTARALMFLISILDNKDEIHVRSVEMAAALGVSDTTARKTMKTLTADNLLIKTNRDNVYVFGGEMATCHVVQQKNQ